MSHYWGDDAYMGGISIRQGANAGKFRPGKRSTEIAIRRKEQLKSQRSNFAADLKARLDLAKRTRIDPNKLKTPPKIDVPKQHLVTAWKPGTSAQPTPTPPPKKPVPSQFLMQAWKPGAGASAATTSLKGLAGLFMDGFYDGLGADVCAPEDLKCSCEKAVKMGFPGITQADCDAIESGGGGAAVDPDPLKDPVTGGPYKGNGKVWLSVEEIDFYWDRWRDYRYPTGISTATWDPKGKPSDPILWPDGTPLRGHMYLPMVDMGAINGAAYKRFVWGVYEADRRHWPTSPDEATWLEYLDPRQAPEFQYKGTHQINGAIARQVEAGAALAPWGQIEPWGPRAETGDKGYPSNDLLGFTHKLAQVWYMNNSFDWTRRDPTSQAYPWLYDNVTSRLIHWNEMPADLWSSNGGPPEEARYLCGPPWPFACVEFLDALATGAHGMPVMISPDGKLDLVKLRQWCTTEKTGKWQKLLTVFGQSPFLCATVYDHVEVQVAPGRNAAQSVPPKNPDPQPTTSVDTAAPEDSPPPVDTTTPTETAPVETLPPVEELPTETAPQWTTPPVDAWPLPEELPAEPYDPVYDHGYGWPGWEDLPEDDPGGIEFVPRWDSPSWFRPPARYAPGFPLDEYAFEEEYGLPDDLVPQLPVQEFLPSEVPPEYYPDTFYPAPADDYSWWDVPPGNAYDWQDYY